LARNAKNPGKTRVLERRGQDSNNRRNPWERRVSLPRSTRNTTLAKNTTQFLLHVVCSWIGNSPRIAQQSYLLVTEDDFARAAGAMKVMVEG